MQSIKPLAVKRNQKESESPSARTGGLRGAVSGRGSVLSKETSKQSISPLKKRVEVTESKGKITGDGSGDGDTSPTKRRKEED